MTRVFGEVDKLLARGRLDLPLTLTAAVSRGDDLLLQQLLKRGLDPNEADNNRRTALHIAASEGNENCVLLLLDYGADPNSKDNDGSTSLWEAMLGKHENIVKLLVDNGACLTPSDMGRYACVSVERNDLELLEDVARYGGDVTVPELSCDRNTPLHVAVGEGNVEIVKFLLDQGADIDRPNIHGWTPRALADQQGHEEIVALFQERKPSGVRFQQFRSEPAVFHNVSREPIRWKGTSTLPNSLFGIVSAAHGDSCGVLSTVGNTRLRVTVSCPEKAGASGKLVFLPESVEELFDIGAKKFGVAATRILTRDGAAIDEVELIRDGDHLLLVSDDWNG